MKTALTFIVAIFLTGFCPPNGVLVEHQEGRFNAIFPEQPKEVVKDAETPFGPQKLTFLVCELGDRNNANALYGIGYTDYPDSLVNSEFEKELTNDFLDRSVTGSVVTLNGSLISSDTISYKGYPGRTIKISFLDNHGIMNMRLYLVKNRMYILEVGCLRENDNNPECRHFFDSFFATGLD